jgi:NAD(P)-dependent dehydrogenase (short-subunit alcohol dehydrogenase family)
MDLRLAGRPALVTASSSGLGAAIARGLAAEGCPVLVHGRDRARAEATTDELRSAGGVAETVLGGAEAMRAMFLADDPQGRDWASLEPELAQRYAPNPTGRLGTPDDVAATVTFLASPLAGYLNGIDVRVDGGLVGTP